MKNIIKISYTPEIDGLKALAILLVLFWQKNFDFFFIDSNHLLQMGNK